MPPRHRRGFFHAPPSADTSAAPVPSAAPEGTPRQQQQQQQQVPPPARKRMSLPDPLLPVWLPAMLLGMAVLFYKIGDMECAIMTAMLFLFILFVMVDVAFRKW